MASTGTDLMTVAEFLASPEDEGSVHKLRRGELVTVAPPKLKHRWIQSQLRDVMKPLAPQGSWLDIQIPFRVLPEHDAWHADIAYLSPERAKGLDPEDYVRGAPDLVIEILSPSNTAEEMYEKEKLCLENGASEFWVVDPNLKQFKVSTPDGRTITYRAGQEIPLPLFGGKTLRVDLAFERPVL